MKAPKRFSREENVKLPNDKGVIGEQVSLSVLESILQTRIDQMMVITLPSDTHRQTLLKQISSIPVFSRRLTAFLDFLVMQVKTYGMELSKTQISLERARGQVTSSCSDDVDRRLDRLAAVLKVSPSKVERRVEELCRNRNRFEFEEDYARAIELLQCKRGCVAEAVEGLQRENERLQRVHAQDRGLLARQNEELRRARLGPGGGSYSGSGTDTETDTETGSEASEAAGPIDGGDSFARTQREQISAMTSELSELMAQVRRLSAQYSRE